MGRLNGSINTSKRHFEHSSVKTKWKEEFLKILMSYRATPYHASGETLAFLTFSRDIRTKMPSVDQLQEQSTQKVKIHHQLYKEKMKDYADKTEQRIISSKFWM